MKDFAKSKFLSNLSFNSFQLSNISGETFPPRVYVDGEKVDFKLQIYFQINCLHALQILLLYENLN